MSTALQTLPVSRDMTPRQPGYLVMLDFANRDARSASARILGRFTVPDALKVVDQQATASVRNNLLATLRANILPILIICGMLVYILST
jgi:hypothetical protein